MLIEDKEQLSKEYKKLLKLKLKLDLTRGRPSVTQLDLSNKLEGILKRNFTQDNIEIRNYGHIDGLPSAKKLAGYILGSDPKNILVNGTSSLTLLGHYIQSLIFKGSGSSPWKDLNKVTILCPVPGYDRHFSLLEQLGIRMIPLPLTGKGPDLNIVEDLINSDDSVRGILCVPKNSNPTGETYTKEVLESLAKLAKSSNEDFKVIFDNAYAVHDFDKSKKLPNIEKIFIDAEAHDHLVMFGSTSKITLAGSGLGFLSLSPNNMKHFQSYFSKLTLGADKVNQARHARLFKNKKDLQLHMQKLAKLIKPKFDLVQKYLENLPEGLGEWTVPTGGYFVSFNSKPGRASRIYSLCENAGLKLTPLGSTFPYGKDLDDKNIRIAPTQIDDQSLKKAMELFCLCVKLAETDYP